MTASISLSAPIVLSPSAPVVSTDAGTLSAVVQTDLSTLVVVASIAGESTALTANTVVDGKRVFTGEIILPLDEGTYQLVLTAQDAEEDPVNVSGPTALTVSIVGADPTVEVNPPASVRILRRYDRVRIEWQDVDTEGFLGVRVRVSPDSSGVDVPFVQYGGLVPNNNSRSEAVVVASNATTAMSVDGKTRTVTQVDRLSKVHYSAVDILQENVGGVGEFYATLTTVVQDPVTHHVFDSVAAGPFKCSFVNLQQVSPTDFPVGVQPEQIATSMVASIAAGYPNLDLTPRSEIRDLQIDPVALELSQASMRGWLTRISSSLSALCQVDDADGDGVSDDPATSTYKQTIARAFRLSDAQVQAVLDRQFDVEAEKAGLTRDGAESAIIPVTFYTTIRPKARITIALGATAATVPDDVTPSLTYRTLGSGAIDPTNLTAYWIPELNGWGITLLCQCLTPGRAGSVGSGTIETVLSGVVGVGMKCTNLTTPYLDGRDRETNAELAARIAVKRGSGVDSGTEPGLTATALGCATVRSAKVVQAGDLEMLRDWDETRGRHTYGCVDVYARGSAYDQISALVPFLYKTLGTPGIRTSYVPLVFAGRSGNRLKFTVDSAYVGSPVALLRVHLDRANGVYLGSDKAVWDAAGTSFYLSPSELSYTLDENGNPTYGTPNSAWLSSIVGASVSGVIRHTSDLSTVPAIQPVVGVTSVTGNGSTGTLPSSIVFLDKTASDPMLEGNSARAKDRILATNGTELETKTLTWATNGLTVLDLGEGVVADTPQFSKAWEPSPGNVVAVRSEDASTLYALGTDYETVVLGPYGHVGIKRAAGSSIPLDKKILVSFNRRQIRENVTKQSETITLAGTTGTTLASPGFLRNTWLPVSHGCTDLVTDADLDVALVTYENRYIKVADATTGKVYREGVDFVLTVDPTTLVATLSRFVSGSTVYSGIPDGGAVIVTYYTTETHTVTYTHPQYLTQLATVIKTTKHGGADTLAKTMIPTPVDLELTVILESAGTASPTVMDPKVRNMIGLVVSNADRRLCQSDLVERISSLPGVSRIQLPLTRMTRADYSYKVGEVIPTSTSWVSPSTLGLPSTYSMPATAWVTALPVLSLNTLPSGGTKYAFVGLLYEGTSYRRCSSLSEFAVAEDPAFYIIGLNDKFNANTPVASQHYGKVLLNTPNTTAAPDRHAYRVTYQVYGEASVQDLVRSPLEYFVVGNVTVAYEIED